MGKIAATAYWTSAVASGDVGPEAVPTNIRLQANWDGDPTLGGDSGPECAARIVSDGLHDTAGMLTRPETIKAVITHAADLEEPHLSQIVYNIVEAPGFDIECAEELASVLAGRREKDPDALNPAVWRRLWEAGVDIGAHLDWDGFCQVILEYLVQDPPELKNGPATARYLERAISVYKPELVLPLVGEDFDHNTIPSLWHKYQGSAAASTILAHRHELTDSEFAAAYTDTIVIAHSPHITDRTVRQLIVLNNATDDALRIIAKARDPEVVADASSAAYAVISGEDRDAETLSVVIQIAARSIHPPDGVDWEFASRARRIQTDDPEAFEKLIWESPMRGLEAICGLSGGENYARTVLEPAIAQAVRRLSHPDALTLLPNWEHSLADLEELTRHGAL